MTFETWWDNYTKNSGDLLSSKLLKEVARVAYREGQLDGITTGTTVAAKTQSFVLDRLLSPRNTVD